MLLEGFILYRLDRKTITDRCREIVESEEIRTQAEFAEIYNKNYGDHISQTTVHRMFANANISINSETGLYTYKPNSPESDNVEDALFTALTQHSYGKYSHEKSVPSMWLSVDFDTEALVARHIYDYCEGNISIISGYGCLWLKCHDRDTFDKLKPLLSKYKCKR